MEGDLPMGTEKRIEAQTSEKTKKELKKLMVDIDTDMTYEELFHAVIRLHETYPGQLEKFHY